MSGLTEYTPNGSIEGSMDRLRHALDHPSAVDTRTADLVESATARLFDLQHPARPGCSRPPWNGTWAP